MRYFLIGFVVTFSLTVSFGLSGCMSDFRNAVDVARDIVNVADDAADVIDKYRKD